MVTNISIHILYRELFSGEQVLVSCAPESFRDLAKLGMHRTLSAFGFSVPSNISYCLASNDLYSLKYRKHGASYNIYIRNSF